MKRRTFLGVAGLAGSTFTLGCFRVAQDSGTNDSGSEATESHENSPKTNEDSEDDQSLMGNEENASEPHSEPHNETATENTTDTNNETMNETTNETNDRQKRPTDDQITPDKSKYNTSPTSQSAEVNDLPADSVTVTSNTKKKGRTYVASGRVTNEIDETIDFVDIEVKWLNENEQPIGTSITTVREIPPGEYKDFKATVSIIDLKGEPHSIDGTAYPQQYV